MKKKGFTLIELLAVIVVLAIIALIAVPIVLNLIKKAKVGADEASARSYVKAVENYMILSELNPDKYPTKLVAGERYQVGTTEYTEETAFIDKIIPTVYAEENAFYLNSVIEMNGNKPSKGTVTIGEKNKVESATLLYSNSTVTCNGDECSSNGKSNSNDVVDSCQYKDGYAWEFDYTGDEQSFIIPCDGTYKLETWGAQGGDATCRKKELIGGYGAYSTGTINLTKSQSLNIVVGGKGITYNAVYTTADGGYNGGGKVSGSDGLSSSYGGAECFGAGGGATHIALTPGLLSTLSTNKDSILIVSGGGGGSAYYYSTSSYLYYGLGGSAGGLVGNSSSNNVSRASSAKATLGGNQLAGASSANSTINGGFGFGGSYNSSSSGGGSGYYGGGSNKTLTGSGGGSSYIGNSLLTDKVMYCYNCTESSEEPTKTISTTNVSNDAINNYAKLGNGYAKITYFSNKK